MNTHNTNQGRLIPGILLSILILSFGCSQPTEPIDILKAQKDSLSSIVADVNAQIASINERLDELDTTTESGNTVVTAIALEMDTFKHFFEVQGTVDADKNILINSELGGVLEWVYVKDGEKVRKGQLLAVLDNESMDANVTEVKSAYELAKITFDKQKRLWDQGIGTELQFLQAKNNKESLEARLRAVSSQGGKTSIRAPFSGTIDQIFSSEGELTGPQVPLFRLVNLDEVKIVADVPENHIISAKAKAPVSAYFEALNKSFNLNLTSVGSFINPANRTFRIYIDLPSSEAFRPNMYSKISICDLEVPNAITVPSSLIQQDRKGFDFVYVIENGMAKKTVVEVGSSEGGISWVKAGLAAGQQIVNEGARSIRDGEKVNIAG